MTLVDCIRHVIAEHPEAHMFVCNRNEALEERMSLTLDDRGEHEMFYLDGRSIYVTDDIEAGCVGACDFEESAYQ